MSKEQEDRFDGYPVDCIIEELLTAETQLQKAKDLVHHAADENERLKKELEVNAGILNRERLAGLEMAFDIKELESELAKTRSLVMSGEALAYLSNQLTKEDHVCCQCNGTRKYYNQLGHLTDCTLCAHRYKENE